MISIATKLNDDCLMEVMKFCDVPSLLSFRTASHSIKTLVEFYSQIKLKSEVKAFSTECSTLPQDSLAPHNTYSFYGNQELVVKHMKAQIPDMSMLFQSKPVDGGTYSVKYEEAIPGYTEDYPDEKAGVGLLVDAADFGVVRLLSFSYGWAYECSSDKFGLYYVSSFESDNSDPKFTEIATYGEGEDFGQISINSSALETVYQLLPKTMRSTLDSFEGDSKNRDVCFAATLWKASLKGCPLNFAPLDAWKKSLVPDINDFVSTALARRGNVGKTLDDEFPGYKPDDVSTMGIHSTFVADPDLEMHFLGHLKFIGNRRTKAKMKKP